MSGRFDGKLAREPNWNQASLLPTCTLKCGTLNAHHVATSFRLNPDGGYNDVGMDEKNTLESYNYVIDHCLRLKLAYIQLVRYLRECWSWLGRLSCADKERLKLLWTVITTVNLVH